MEVHPFIKCICMFWALKCCLIGVYRILSVCSSKHGLYNCVCSYGCPPSCGRLAAMFVVASPGSVLEESCAVWPGDGVEFYLSLQPC